LSGHIALHGGTAARWRHQSRGRRHPLESARIRTCVCVAEARMKNRRAITDADLQDYIEGRLSPALRKKVEEMLAKDARLADEIDRLRRQAVKLQDFGKAVLDEPIPPEMIELIEKFRRD